MEEILEAVKNFLLSGELISFVLRIFAALILLIIGFRVGKRLGKKLMKARLAQELDRTLRSFACNFITFLFDLLIVLACMAILGVEMTSIAALIASIGVTIGLALQGGLSNITGGLLIAFLKPFEVGDYIVSEGAEGTVTDIGVFYTRLLTIDNLRVVIPNGKISNAVVTDCTANETRRADIPLSIPYGTDAGLVRETLLKVADEEALALKDPAPMAVILGYRDSAVEWSFRVWGSRETYWDMYFSLLDKTAAALKEQGIEIAFPQLDVHLPEKK